MLLAAALNRAVKAMRDHKECFELFGNQRTRSGNVIPISILTDLVNGTSKYGKITFENKGAGGDIAKTTPTGSVFIYPLPPFLKSNAVDIVINTYNDDAHLYWNDGDADENAVTLLHELGHLYNFVRGSGGSQLSNLKEAFNSSANDNILITKCFP
jgi:hypothetical protein